MDPDPPLALVFSHDVARFVVSLLDASLQENVPRCDFVNLCCSEQKSLSGLLTLLSAASGCPDEKPRLSITKNPKTFLPSVERPWPLSLHRACKIYGFTPTPLEEVLKQCAHFFKHGCRKFPREARKAAKKIPGVAADIALWVSGLDAENSSGESG